MFDMFMHSVVLFLRGKLFQSPLHVVRQSAIGVLLTAALCILLTRLVGALWIAVPVSALLGGGLQPFLFKNLKYN
jgi:hypothetical protein